MGLFNWLGKGYRKVLMRQFQSSIPKGLKKGSIKWGDDFEKMANEILDLTGQRENLEVMGQVSVKDVVKLLEKHKDEWKSLGVK